MLKCCVQNTNGTQHNTKLASPLSVKSYEGLTLTTRFRPPPPPPSSASVRSKRGFCMSASHPRPLLSLLLSPPHSEGVEGACQARGSSLSGADQSSSDVVFSFPGLMTGSKLQGAGREAAFLSFTPMLLTSGEPHGRITHPHRQTCINAHTN